MRDLETTGHTIVRTDENGGRHVQHVGAEQVVEGSVRIIDVPAGSHVVIRHVMAKDTAAA